MAAPDTGELTKLRIVAFEEREQDNLAVKDFGHADPTSDTVFEAYFNPNSFSTTLGITYGAEGAVGAAGKLMPFKEYSTTTYSFELMLDGTGASIPKGAYASKPPTVPELIQKFTKVAYDYRGAKHEPPFLRLEWGTTSVPRCILTGATIKHDLFKPDGTALRATIACSFSEYWTQKLIDAYQNRQSPDMTHVRVVQLGDRLPLMCEHIYGDASLYLQVARFNKLSNYRNLVPGQKILFPPLIPTKAK
jgi:hypothetical protein